MQFSLIVVFFAGAHGLRRGFQAPLESAETSEGPFSRFLAKHGGNATVLMVGDSTMSGLHIALEKIAPAGLKFTLVENKGCLNQKTYPMTPQPDVVIYNNGLHVLHLYPALSCTDNAHVAAGHGFEKDLEWESTDEDSTDPLYLEKTLIPHLKGNRNCGHYSDIVRDAMEYFKAQAPKAQIMWKTTNSICSDVFVGDFRQAVDAWHNETTRLEREKACRLQCPARYSGVNADRNCGDEIYDEHSTQLQHDTSMEVLKSYSDVMVVDAFAITKDHCEATGQQDGRHYHPLDSKIALDMARQLDSL